MLFQVGFDTSDLEQVLEAFVSTTRDLSPVMQEIAADMVAQVTIMFDTGGAGRFPPLAPSTLAWKARHGYSSTPLIRTGAWRNGLEPYADAHSASVSTRVPYGVFHTAEGPRTKIPYRNPFDLPVHILEGYAVRIENHIVASTKTRKRTKAR